MTTRWKPHHKVWITLFAIWAFSYADRTITGPVVTWMIENKVGFLQSAARPYALGGLLGSLFFAGYMLTQFPGGYFGDKYGHRTVIVISIFWAGVTTILTGLTGGLVAFVPFVMFWLLMLRDAFRLYIRGPSRPGVFVDRPIMAVYLAVNCFRYPG